jgi:drug/metabolite transporter (DMT)-like permease
VIFFILYTSLFEDFSKWSAAVGKAHFSSQVTAALLGIAYQGFLVAGLCFAIQAHLLRKHAAFQISVYSFSTPLFGLLFAFAFRDDPYSSWLPLSAVCVAIGIILVNLEPKNKSDSSVTAPAAPATPEPPHHPTGRNPEDQPGDHADQANQ